MSEHERILAGDIKPGDRVARSRNDTFETVVAVERGPVAVRLLGSPVGTRSRTIARPRQTAKWWREVPDA